jgi:hypothetical protein
LNAEVKEPPSTGRNAELSAARHAEPTTTASPTGGQNSSKTKATTRSDGKGKLPTPGVVPETLFQLYSSGPDISCPETIVPPFDIPAGIILAPGESITQRGSLIATNVCRCPSSTISAGVTGNPTTLLTTSGKGKTIIEEADDTACAAVAINEFLLQATPSSTPSSAPSKQPSWAPSSMPSEQPSWAPSSLPSASPVQVCTIM